MRKTLSILLFFAILFSLTACGGTEITSKHFDLKAVGGTLEEELIAENSSLRLEWDDVTKGVFLTDLESGLKWGTTPIGEGEAQFDEFGMPIKKHPKVNSVIAITYLDYETNTVVDTNSYSAAVENGRVRCAEGKNSLLVEFYFDAPQIMVPVQFILKKDHLQIKIKADDIQEEKNKVIKISVAPFMCSAKNDSSDSYLFVPSGSGTLILPTILSQQGINYSSQVYGTDSTIEMIAKTTEKESVRLPVYGVRSSAKKGMLAIIQDSSDSALVEVSAGASAYGYSAVYSSFQVRGYTGHVANLFSGLNVESMVYSEAKIGGIFSVGFYPLTGSEADYSGMARLYRSYLEKNQGLKNKCEEAPLNLTFLGGTMLTDSFCGIPYERLYATTTIEQARDILKNVSNELNMPINVVLKGFGETGVDAGTVGGGFKIASNLGKTKELSALQKFCDDNSLGFYIDFDVVRFSESGKGFSKNFDTCYNAGEKMASQYQYNPAVLKQEKNTLHYLLVPSKISQAIEKTVSASEKMGVKGVSLSTLSSMSYSDYSDKTSTAYYSKSGFSKIVRNNLNEIKKNGIKIASSAANSYAAVLSDIVLNAPTQSDREHIFYTDVPFYEMVFKGCVPMSVGSVNLSEDKNHLILKAVESGCGLNYTIIDHWSTKLLTNSQPLFYNSVYSEIKDGMFSDMQRLSDYYKKVNGAHISEHRLLAKNLRMTAFDNGVVVYVNYGDLPLDSPVGTIEANDFVVAKGDNQ